MSVADRFWAKVNIGPDCWEWVGARTSVRGVRTYGVFWLHGKNVPSHRVSFELHFGTLPSGKFVLHKCDNPGCVRPTHLFAGTHTDNMRDMLSKGRGPRLPHALSEEQTLRARTRFANKESSAALLAREMGVSISVMYLALRGGGPYRRLPNPIPPAPLGARGVHRTRRCA